MDNYWFYLENYVYAEVKQQQALLYNTLNGDCLKITAAEVIALIQGVCDLDNLGSVAMEGGLLDTATTGKCLQEIIDRKMGNVSVANAGREKPVRLRPVLNLNKDVEKLSEKTDAELYLKKDISKYLLKLDVYLNSTCMLSCPDCGQYVRQFDCCTKQHGPHTDLPPETLENIFGQIRYFPIQGINFLGGDIYRYPHLDLLEQGGMKSGKRLHFYVYYENYRPDKRVDSHYLELIIRFPVDERKLYAVKERIAAGRTKSLG